MKDFPKKAVFGLSLTDEYKFTTLFQAKKTECLKVLWCKVHSLFRKLNSQRGRRQERVRQNGKVSRSRKMQGPAVVRSPENTLGV